MTSPASTDDQDLIPTVPDGAAAPLVPTAEGGRLELSSQGRNGRYQVSPTHAPFLNFVRYLKGDREAIGEVSYLVARHHAETALLATDRSLALLYRIEAIADQRADNDVAAVAKLPAIRDLARAAIAAHTGAPFDNPLFPLRPVAR
jgi:hypothetical protein